LDIWLQQEGEPNIWHQRFTSYRLMGHKRSLLGCLREEKARQAESEARSSQERRDPPKSIPGAWREACKRWQWETKAAAWDTEQARSAEVSVTEARSSLVKKQIHLESKWLDDEAELRTKSHEWLRKFLFSEVVEVKTTEKEKTGDDGCSSEKSTTTTQKLPPQWVLERFMGRRDYEKQFSVLMDLLKNVMAIEDNSEGVHQVKGMIQASLEGLLLESGVDEVRTLLNSGNS
jgi:hypothetical protein